MIRRKFFLSAALAVALPLSAGVASAALLYNPVVTVVGNGSVATSGAGYTTSLYIYDNSVVNQASPIAQNSYNNGSSSGSDLVTSVSATSEGQISNNPALTANAVQGLPSSTGYVFNAGYNVPEGTAAVNSTTTVGRSVGAMTVGPNSLSNPTVVQTQSGTAAYNANNIRGAGGNDTATTVYSAGTNGTGQNATGGWRNFTTNTQLATTPTNTRTIEDLSGGVFGVTSSGSTVGIYSINTTTNTATSYLATGTSSNHSPYEFVLFDDPSNTNVNMGYNLAYIADDDNTSPASADTNGGIEKWSWNGTSWTQLYVLQDTSTTFYRGLAGELDASTGKITLFATTADGTKLQQVTDTGAGSAFTTLATVPTNDAFRGVALAPVSVPEPSSMALCGLAALGSLGFVIRRRS